MINKTNTTFRLFYEANGAASGLTDVQVYIFKPDGTKLGPYTLTEVVNGSGTGVYFYDYAVGVDAGEYLFIVDSATAPLKSIRQVTFDNNGFRISDNFRVYYIAKNNQSGLTDVKLQVYKPDFTKDPDLPMLEMADPIAAGVYYHDYFVGTQEGQYLFSANSASLPFKAVRQLTFLDLNFDDLDDIKGPGFDTNDDSLAAISEKVDEIAERCMGEDGGSGSVHIEFVIKDNLGAIKENKLVKIYRERDFAVVGSDISAVGTGKVEFDLDPGIYLVSVIGSQVFDRKAYERLIVNP